MDKIDHVAIKAIVDRIANSAGDDEPERNRPGSFEKQISCNHPNHDDADQKQKARIARKQAPSHAGVGRVIDRKLDSAEIKNRHRRHKVSRERFRCDVQKE